MTKGRTRAAHKIACAICVVQDTIATIRDTIEEHKNKSMPTWKQFHDISMELEAMRCGKSRDGTELSISEIMSRLPRGHRAARDFRAMVEEENDRDEEIAEWMRAARGFCDPQTPGSLHRSIESLKAESVKGSKGTRRS